MNASVLFNRVKIQFYDWAVVGALETDEAKIRETPGYRTPPAVLRKLDAPSIRMPWYDWALTGLSVSVFLFFPQLILVFAYHL